MSTPILAAPLRVLSAAEATAARRAHEARADALTAAHRERRARGESTRSKTSCSPDRTAGYPETAQHTVRCQCPPYHDSRRPQMATRMAISGYSDGYRIRLGPSIGDHHERPPLREGRGQAPLLRRRLLLPARGRSLARVPGRRLHADRRTAPGHPHLRHRARGPGRPERSSARGGGGRRGDVRSPADAQVLARRAPGRLHEDPPQCQRGEPAVDHDARRPGHRSAPPGLPAGRRHPRGPRRRLRSRAQRRERLPDPWRPANRSSCRCTRGVHGAAVGARRPGTRHPSTHARSDPRGRPREAHRGVQGQPRDRTALPRTALYGCASVGGFRARVGPDRPRSEDHRDRPSAHQGRVEARTQRVLLRDRRGAGGLPRSRARGAPEHALHGRPRGDDPGPVEDRPAALCTDRGRDPGAAPRALRVRVAVRRSSWSSRHPDSAVRQSTSPGTETRRCGEHSRTRQEFATPSGRYYGTHELRHSTATLLARSGASLATIRAALGHSRIETSLRYQHPDQAEMLAASGDASGDGQ